MASGVEGMVMSPTQEDSFRRLSDQSLSSKLIVESRISPKNIDTTNRNSLNGSNNNL